jgi:hypothetical protein
LAEIREARRPLLRAAAGVIIAVLMLGIGSAAMFGVERGWVSWTSKISSHASKPNINHVGLRTVLTYEPEDFQPGEDWVEQQRRVHQSRKPIILLIGLIFLVACVIACREVDSHQAVITGMLLLPMVFYPSNYYLHFIFVVPALAADRSDEGIDWRWAGTGLVLLAMSFTEYFSNTGVGQHAKFTNWSLGLGVGFSLILGERVWNSVTRAGWLRGGAEDGNSDDDGDSVAGEEMTPDEEAAEDAREKADRESDDSSSKT